MKPQVPDGIKIKYNHYRIIWGFGDPQKVTKDNRFIAYVDTLDTHGGRTEVTLSDEEGPLCKGFAYCNDIDPFNKRLGRTIALNQALYLLEHPESDGALTYLGQPKRVWLRAVAKPIS